MRTSCWTKLLDVVAPRRCVSCGRRLYTEESLLCVACHIESRRTHFEQSPKDNDMARLFWGLVPIEKAAALYFYHPGSHIANLIHTMKYRGRPLAAWQAGELLARHLAPTQFFNDIDVLVPVPLTWGRQWRRGYNQCVQMAKGISEVTGLPIAADALRRTRFTGSQTQLAHEERRRNVEGVFELRNAASVRGRHVLLIDDVVTTGATTLACLKELAKAEGVRVSVASLGFTRDV